MHGLFKLKGNTNVLLHFFSLLRVGVVLEYISTESDPMFVLTSATKSSAVQICPLFNLV